MHVILGFLGTIVTILWLLHRLAEMGIDLGGLNPFLWRRRRKWRQQFHADPIYAIDNPMEATALLITATAKADGDMSAEEKQTILAIFEDEFHLGARDAAALLASSSHLLGNGETLRDNLDAVMAASLPRYTPEQAESAVELLASIARVGGPPSAMQAELIERATGLLRNTHLPKGKWEETA